MAIKAVLTPMLIAALGTILSLLGVYAVRVKRGASQTELMAALNRGINLSSFLIAIASAFLLQLIGLDNWAGIWGAIVTGLAVGIVIGKSTEHYTSHESRFPSISYCRIFAVDAPRRVSRITFTPYL